MKTTLAIVLLLAMLAVPSTFAAPDSNPNGNPMLSASDMAITGDDETPGGTIIQIPDGPGFSEWGLFAAEWSQTTIQEGSNMGKSGKGASTFAPALGRPDEPPEPPGEPV
jgi:hypothetical protein